MARKAIVKIGPFTATLEDRTPTSEESPVFISEDESTANVLNDALQSYYRIGRGLFPTGSEAYWPDYFRGLVEAIAKYCGGELIECDPPEERESPEGTVY